MFEHRTEPLLDWVDYLRRQLKFAGGALAIVGVSLLIGTWGYMHFADLPGVDAFLNASMILAGMGPVDELVTERAKWFASVYALYSGIALLTIVAVMLAPMAHRILHALHLDESDQ